MKFAGIILLQLFFLTASKSFGQDATAATESLQGIWYLSYQSYPSTTDSLVYNRASATAPHNWGDRIEFTSDNFTDAYSSHCGNDTRIHADKGTWYLSDRTLTTSIPISVDLATK